MKRRFLLLLFAAVCFCMNAQVNKNLDVLKKDDFMNPPMQARPSTYWMWMNGHITKEGLTADLEYMKRNAYGAAMMFNTGVGIPRGAVDYASPQWEEMTIHAVKEAERLGMELYLQNSPGYSGTGGPWITPEYSMQQLEWTETLAMLDKKDGLVLESHVRMQNKDTIKMLLYSHIQPWSRKPLCFKTS